VGQALVEEHELRPVAVLNAGDGEIVGAGHYDIGLLPAAGVWDYQKIVDHELKVGRQQRRDSIGEIVEEVVDAAP
jgi:hypothetical protein